MTPEDRYTLAKKVHLLSCHPGQVVLKQGEEGQNFYVVIAGAVEV
jgi:CRP-like cAMP-binding protein